MPREPRDLPSESNTCRSLPFGMETPNKKIPARILKKSQAKKYRDIAEKGRKKSHTLPLFRLLIHSCPPDDNTPTLKVTPISILSHYVTLCLTQSSLLPSILFQKPSGNLRCHGNHADIRAEPITFQKLKQIGGKHHPFACTHTLRLAH